MILKLSIQTELSPIVIAFAFWQRPKSGQELAGPLRSLLLMERRRAVLALGISFERQALASQGVSNEAQPCILSKRKGKTINLLQVPEAWFVCKLA